MKNERLQLYKSRYVVRAVPADSAHDVKKNLLDLAHLRDAVCKKWQGKQDAVQEIREQRGGTL